MECCIPNSSSSSSSSQQSQQQAKHQQRHNNRRSFGVLKSFLRAVALVIMGFVGGVAYNQMYSHQTSVPPANVGSIPASDELVQTLAHDNQVQQEEIQHLQEQINEITASRKSQENKIHYNQQHPQRSQPQVIYRSDSLIQEQEEAAAAAAAATGKSSGSQLRTIKQAATDEESNSDNPLKVDADQAQQPASFMEDSSRPEELASEPIRRDYVSAIDPLPSYVPAEEEHAGAPRPAPIGGGKMPPPPKGKRTPLHMQHEVHDYDQQGQKKSIPTKDLEDSANTVTFSQR